MVWETNTASSHLDLLSRLKTFLCTNSTLVSAGQNWTELRTLSALPYTATTPGGRIAFGMNTNTIHADAWPSGVSTTTQVKIKITGTLTCPTTGSYQFVTSHSEWLEVRIDGVLVYANYTANYDTAYEATAHWTQTLSSGAHTIEVRTIGVTATQRGVAVAWKKPGDPSFLTIPAANYSGLNFTWGYTQGSGSGSVSNFNAILNDTETVLRGPGLSSADQIFIALNTVSNAAVGYYNLEITGAIGYNAALAPNRQPGYDTTVSRKGMLLWDQPMKYWFIASGRRFIVIAKVSTTYQTMYGGFILPYGLPVEYPYPLLIGASTDDVSSIRWSDTTTAHSSFFTPLATASNGGATALREVGGAWRQFQIFTGATGQGLIGPYNQSGLTGYNVDVRSSPSGDYGLNACILFSSTIPFDVWGEFDGVYYVPGYGNASENIITISGQDYLVVQSGFRTTNTDYAAIKLA